MVFTDKKSIIPSDVKYPPSGRRAGRKMFHILSRIIKSLGSQNINVQILLKNGKKVVHKIIRKPSV